MPSSNRGFVDSYHQSRINHVAGTGYPAAILTPYIGLYLGALPASDGSGNTDAVRTAVTFAAAALDGASGRYYVQPNAALTFVVPTAGEVVGWGLYSASSGGTPIYRDQAYPFRVTAGQSVTLPASEFRVWAEGAL